MVSQTVTIRNTTGLYLHPVGVFCQTAMLFTSKIKFKIDDDEANAKSVLSVLGACVKAGDELLLICEGEDEAGALAAMVEVIDNGLGE